MSEFVGFHTMVIQDQNSISFHSIGVFGLVSLLLFKSGSSYCGQGLNNSINGHVIGVRPSIQILLNILCIPIVNFVFDGIIGDLI